MEYCIWVLAIVRIVLCLLPQNRWLANDGSVTMGIIRNIPFVIMGLMIVALYFKKRKEDKVFKKIWLYVLLSFLFYIPVVVGASSVPILGMLMLPKTVCYILMIVAFYKESKNNNKNS
jgi:peptidoglycan/LPS O-acetylase OafA/YrhL